MNELDQNLLTGEQVVFETTKHWWSVVRTSIIAGLLVLGALVLRAITPNGDGILGSIGGVLDLVAFGVLLVGIAWILYNVGELLSSHFGVTNMRVLRYEGLLRRRTSETLLPTLTDVQLIEPAIGRMLDFGNLRILTASGAAGEDVFETVRDAKRLRTAIQEQKASSMAGGAPAAAAPAAVPSPQAAAAPPAAATSDPSAALAALDDLKAKALISDEEYEVKRQEILGRI